MEAKTDSLNQFHLLSHPSEEIVECPSCDAKIKRFEVAEHYQYEMERLKKMKLRNIKDIKPNGMIEDEDDDDEAVASREDRRKPWTVFQRIQKNRQSRLRSRHRRRPASPVERACPICNQNFPQDEIESHAEECLRQSSNDGNGSTNGNEDNSSDDGDAGEEYEEYEWAGQKRIRVSSLLQGGYASIGIGQTISNRNDDEDEDLNVDEDDTHIYGPAQYGEGDVIGLNTDASETGGGNGTSNEDDEANVTNYVRKLITENSCTSSTSTSSSKAKRSDVETAETNIKIPKMESDSLEPSSSSVANVNTTADQIIESLKAKLRYYENQVQSKFKCLICLDDYKNPAISVACWHVHCEQCWLRSLGARKLCPQCNLITTPKDLRRIYM